MAEEVRRLGRSGDAFSLAGCAKGASVSASLRLVVLGAILALSGCAAARTGGVSGVAIDDALCSAASVAERISGVEYVEGRGLSIPDPTQADHLDAFWRVHNTLMTLIDMDVARANLVRDPVEVGRLGTGHAPRLSPYWRSTELGVGTNGDAMLCPETRGTLGGGSAFCAAADVGSFLNELRPVGDVGDEVAGSSFYWKVVNHDPKFGEPRYGSLVYVEPTAHPCVSRMLLAEATSVGTWLPGWVLHDRSGKAFLIVDDCVDLYDAYGTEFSPLAPGPSTQPKPAVAFFAAIQQPCPTAAQCCRGPGQPCFR